MGDPSYPNLLWHGGMDAWLFPWILSPFLLGLQQDGWETNPGDSTNAHTAMPTQRHKYMCKVWKPHIPSLSRPLLLTAGPRSNPAGLGLSAASPGLLSPTYTVSLLCRGAQGASSIALQGRGARLSPAQRCGMHLQLPHPMRSQSLHEAYTSLPSLALPVTQPHHTQRKD